MSIARIGTPGQINLPTGDSGSGSMTVEAGCDFFLVCGVAYRSVAGGLFPSLTSITIDGGAMTRAISQDDNSYYQGAMFYRLSPAAGSKTFSWAWPFAGGPGGADGGVWVYASYSGVDQDSPIRDAQVQNTDGTGFDTVTPITTPTLTALANDLVVAWIASFTAAERTFSFVNATKIYDATRNTTGDGALGEASPTGNQTVGALTSAGGTGEDGSVMAIVLKPASASGPTTPGHYRLAGPTQLGTTASTVFTAAAKTRIETISVSNPTGSPVTLTLSIGTDAAGTRLFDAYSIPAGAEKSWNVYIPIENTEVIQAKAGSAGALVLDIDGTVI